MNSNIVDPTNFDDLKACDWNEVVSRTRCKFDADKNQYETAVWGHEYIVDLDARKVRAKRTGAPDYGELMDLFVLYYLMRSKDIPVSRNWVSQKDIPGGEGFFRGPHTIPTHTITQRFGDDLSAFERVCENAGGRPLEMADAAFSFFLTPTIPVALLFWQGDEDFPSEVTLLFDQTISEHLPLDIIFCLAVGVCRRLQTDPVPS